MLQKLPRRPARRQLSWQRFDRLALSGPRYHASSIRHMLAD